MKEKALKLFDYAGLVSVCFLIFFIPISNALISSFLGFIILFFLLRNIIKPDLGFLFYPEFSAILLFFAFSALSLMNSGPLFGKSINALFLKWGRNFLIFFVVYDILRRPAKMRAACLYIFLISAFLIGIDCITQRFIQFDFFRHKPLIRISPGDLYAVTASFAHYNDLGAYLVLILSVVIAMLFSRVNLLSRLILLVLMFLSIISLLLSYSRGSWIGFFISLAVMIYLLKRYKIIPQVLLLFIVLLFLPLFRERFFLIFKYGGIAGRFDYWLPAWRMITENPWLGKGLGTFMDYFAKYQPNIHPSYAHNCYLQIWAESGIFSLLAFLLFIFLLISRAFKAYKLTGDKLLLGLICGFCAFVFEIFFDTHLYSLQLSVFFWLVAGAIAALSTDAVKGA